MKRHFIVLIITAFLLITPILMFAQAPPHPNGGAAPGAVTNNTPVGGGAPVGSGTMLLIGLAGLYGSKKVYSMRKSLEA
ncbi:MAG: hypothetical protein WCM93_13355 [Bacteroidota bacterium]